MDIRDELFKGTVILSEAKDLLSGPTSVPVQSRH